MRAEGVKGKVKMKGKGSEMIQGIIDNSSHISGSIEGISGTDVDLNLLGDGNDDLQLD